MITLTHGNLLETDAEALVNTINTVGVMGKGIALQFKDRYPTNYQLYLDAFKRGDLKPGKMLVTETGELSGASFIINFPTKQHWREKSKLWYVEEGLVDLVGIIQRFNIRSIAIPPLGCGNGGLDWAIVKPLIVEAFQALPEVEVILFEPSEQAYQSPRKRKGAPPRLTTTRAMILHSLYRYQEKGYEITILEIQKLVYFLQRLGVNFKGLTFEKGHYGPYAQKLQHAINDLDGYYLDGMKYGDAKPQDILTLRTEHLSAIKQFIDHEFSDEERQALLVIDQLINGFESPLGLEMLATADFLVQKDPNLRRDSKSLISLVQDWSDRKARLMKPEYLEITLQRLEMLKEDLYPVSG